VAIGGGFELSQGVIARALAPAHVIAVASADYLAGRALPQTPDALGTFKGIAMRGSSTGRIRQWVFRNAEGTEAQANINPDMVVNDPAALRPAALLGLGVALLVVMDVQPWIESGALVRLLPGWYADAGHVSLYYPSRTLMPAKNRVFIDYLAQAFDRESYARRFVGGPD
jgi:DNA-binding transcriptional LysR family regulator